MYKEARKQAGLSLDEAAYRLSVAPRTLAKYEAGELRVPGDMRLRVAGAVMQNHGWRRLRFSTFVLERGPFNLAMLRARDRAQERGVCPYCGSPYRTWVAGEGIVHFGCLSCGGVYKEEVPLEDESA